MKRFVVVSAAFCAAMMLGACAMFCCPQGNAEKFAVNNIYDSHMVLQRQKPIQIVGTAEAGKRVKVAIGENSVVAKADKQGVWKAVLPAMEAGGPYSVTISGAEGIEPIVLKDVLVGEVWFCSGQSNMQMPVVGGRFWCSMNGPEEAAAANFPQIRIFQVANVVSPGIEKDAITSRTSWEVCTPETIGKFSACGFYFGRQLYKELGVPIGLINSSWGGTRIEPWISKAGFESANRTQELQAIQAAETTQADEMLKKQKVENDRKVVAWLENVKKVYAAEAANAKDWASCSCDLNGWKTTVIPAFAWDKIGAFWFRRTIELPAEWAGKDLQINLGGIDDLDETFFNGEKVGETKITEESYWNKKRIYTIPGKLVKAGKNTIAIRMLNVYGDGGFCDSASSLFISDGKARLPLAGEWFERCEFIADAKKVGVRPSVVDTGLKSCQYPATLYNAMVKPWIVFPMRGFIWYQGCSNTDNPANYMELHPLLIQDWRNKWNDQEMPFIFAQLAAFARHTPNKRLTEEQLRAGDPPTRAPYAELREVQTATLKVPGSGMGVAIDIGDHSDIHTANKQELGYRMAQEAKRLAYGYKGITAGPMFKAMKAEGNKIRIEYTNVGSGLEVRNGKLGSFAIAGKDGKFVWANAELDGNTVVVWAESVKEPVDVRYAWAGYPMDTNLYNKEGFPACPFRTDTPDYLLK